MFGTTTTAYSDSNLISDITSFFDWVVNVFLLGNNFKILNIPLIFYIIIPILIALLVSFIRRDKD